MTVPRYATSPVLAGHYQVQRVQYSYDPEEGDQAVQIDGLDRLINEGGRVLSGGQRQMVQLSRLIVRNPQIVLLDEPTASMDEQLEAWVIRQLQQ